MRIKFGRIFILIIIIGVIVGFAIYFIRGEKIVEPQVNLMIDLTNKNINDIESYINDNKLSLTTKYEYSEEVAKDLVISQSINLNEEITKNEELVLVVSLGKIDREKLKVDGINELGKVPVMMYHGIVNKKDSETVYIGGNVDKDGYNRTTESFRKDLEFYYANGYRTIRLTDYVDGNINVEYGYSPIVITFDDGNENNLKVTGLDVQGNIIIDENSAVGILEAFKKEHPDFNATATFFVNGGLFNQSNYNDKILKWLVDNGYDVGNHTYNHDDLSKTTFDATQKTISQIYKRLDEIIPGKYVKIIALPFGAPYNKSHANFSYVLNGTYDNYTYSTTAALRVGWEPEVSPFDKNFDKTYIKRCRAYDNNGKEFDIKMVFDNLKNSRYISDGEVNRVIIPSGKLASLNTEKEVIQY